MEQKSALARVREMPHRISCDGGVWVIVQLFAVGGGLIAQGAARTDYEAAVRALAFKAQNERK